MSTVFKAKEKIEICFFKSSLPSNIVNGVICNEDQSKLFTIFLIHLLSPLVIFLSWAQFLIYCVHVHNNKSIHYYFSCLKVHV